MKGFLTLLTLTFIMLHFNAVSQLYTFRNYNHKDGLTIASISSIHASSDGNIWLGTDGAGLIRFNGKEFDEISYKLKDDKHHVTAIVDTKDGQIFSSLYFGIYEYKQGKIYQLLKQKSLIGETKKIQLIDSNLFIATNKQFSLFTNGKLKQLKLFTTETTVTECINVPGGLIVLSNQGNFFISSQLKRLIPLNNWLKNKKDLTQSMAFGYFKNNNLYLCDKKLERWIHVVLTDKSGIFSSKVFTQTQKLHIDESVISCKYDAVNNKFFHLTSLNNLYVSIDNKTRFIATNYADPLIECKSITTDINGDIWLISSLKGLYKVSQEPFTKLCLHPIYSKPDIMSLHRSLAGDIFVSTMEGKTYVGGLLQSNSDFKEYDFRTFCYFESKDKLFLGTSAGLKIFNTTQKQFQQVIFNGLENEKIIMLFSDNKNLWVGISGKGLWKYDLTSGKILKKIEGKKIPQFFYTVQYNEATDQLYFGTNNGIYCENLTTGKFYSVAESLQNGSYVGVSIKDIYGTSWFTGEFGLFGILKNGDFIFHKDPKYFNSTLFYTLNSDNYGNLLIGTNKGITILELNESGKVLHYKSYSGNSGFGGFETHMRSQFQDQNTIFVGTIEGLFSINTSVLRNFPRPTAPNILPIIQRGMGNQSGSFAFEFFTNNPKIAGIQYSYRIKGIQNDWSNLSTNEKLYLSDLPNGKFILEVKSTYDGFIYSDIGTKSFEISQPFYRTKWFILFLILLVVLINIFVITRQKSFDGGNFFRTKDTLVELSLTPSIILFGFIADVVTNYVAPLIDHNIPNQIGLTSIAGFAMLSLYLLAKNAQRSGQTSYYRYYLMIGYTIVMLHFLFGSYFSSLHPYYIYGVVLISTISPYIFERLKFVVIQDLILLIICCSMALFMNETIYNRYLFLIAVIVAVCFTIFITYLRYDSLEKLIFISGVVNKGNVQVIAFNGEGTITYVSENIKDIISIDHTELINQKISILNNHLPDEGNYRLVDLTTQFYDGQKYLAPHIKSNGDLSWVEWSCKVFSKNVKVILGQNVSDRMELETTYELLVENAEDLIYQCDVDGNFRFLNKQCFEKLGYSKEEIEGKYSIDFILPEYQDEVKKFYRDHFEQRKTTSYSEFPIRTKHGEILWVGQHVTTLFKQGIKKHVKGFLALARDITLKRVQEQIIREQRDDITSSITYAKRIQDNLLPNEVSFSSSFEEYFLLYEPKDIVSGDFYWMHRIDGCTIVALGDCTGHGVPGAFMTLLGINILNSTVLENRIIEPSQILNEMDKKLTTALHGQMGSEEISDGMEITICVFDHHAGTLSFACAGSRFLIFENGAFNMYKGDIKHVGDNDLTDFKGYVTHSLPFNDQSTVYLFTDGFQDQFGGTKNKKFTFRRLLELFESNIRLPLKEQKPMIQDEFNYWKQQFEQTDDVTIIALKKLKN